MCFLFDPPAVAGDNFLASGPEAIFEALDDTHFRLATKAISG